MADLVQRLDPSKLVLVGAALSFAVSASEAPSYNLPIFLFGIYAQENSEVVQSLQAFTYLLAASVLYDLIWMYNYEQYWVFRLITVITTVLKLPAVLAFMMSLQQRGAQFSIRGNDLGGATVWSMPGGFTSNVRGGYQNVDEPVDVQTPKPLGSTPADNTQPAAPGAYQSV